MASVPIPGPGPLVIANNMREARCNGWGKWHERPPYGDDPTDQRNIREGIDYAIENGY